MTVEILLVRDNSNIPWGFRLTGGRDFNSPLTVIKITGQSIAEKRGLKVGDIITEINNQKTNNLCHNEAQRFIADGGNFLKFIVLRGSSPGIPPALTPVRGTTPVLSCTFERKRTASILSAESVGSLYEDDSFEFLDQSGDEFAEFHEPTEDEINQMLLENAEVIEEKGKNVIGVNFKRFIPKCEFIKDSAVFQVLQEEQVYKELSEKEQLQRCPNKRFSTFLAPPDRPIPEPKPKLNQSRNKSPLQNLGEEAIPDNQRNNFADDHKDQHAKNENESSEIEEMSSEKQDTCEEGIEKNDSRDNENDNQENDPNIESTSNDPIEQNTENREETESDQKSNNYVVSSQDEFENKLSIIKNTLNSLQQLPSLIQSQIAAIQAQIDQLTLSRDHDTEKNLTENSDIDLETADEPVADAKMEPELEIATVTDFNEDEVSKQSSDNIENDDNQEQGDQVGDNSEEMSSENENTESIPNGEENSENKPSAVQEDCPKRRPACPLTPLPRPVVLPGGRIWRKPKDAYNEEFIAETLISQAEVLVGSTMGVNFRKYEPPKFDLSNSAVYKLVHNIESKKTGLGDRDTIPSLQDYYQSPISARHFYCANLANREKKNERNDDENQLDSSS